MSVIDDCKSIVVTWENHPELMEHNQDEYYLRKSLIEYDQALREAQNTIKSLCNNTALWVGNKYEKSINSGREWLDKYSHLLKGE